MRTEGINRANLIIKQSTKITKLAQVKLYYVDLSLFSSNFAFCRIGFAANELLRDFSRRLDILSR